MGIIPAPMQSSAQAIVVRTVAVCHHWRAGCRARLRPVLERRRARGAILALAAAMLSVCGGCTGLAEVFSLPTASPEAVVMLESTATRTVQAANSSPTSTTEAISLATAVDSATATVAPTPTQKPSATPTREPALAVYIAPELPMPFANALGSLAAGSPGQARIAAVADTADVRLVPGHADVGEPVGSAVYVVVAPFPTVEDDVAWPDVAAAWNGAPRGAFSDRPFFVAADTALALATQLGPPGPSVQVVAAEDLVASAWGTRPSWAVVPFDGLEPLWKVLRLDGMSVLDRQFDPVLYPLTLPVSLEGGPEKIAALRQLLAGPLTNREANRIAVVTMTGVTALARGTAMRMDWHGLDYPAEDIRPWLTEADITHISSEVSFAPDCPPPTSYVTTVFCSDPRYIELIDDLDIDIIELTGNHLLDWGQEAMDLSLRLYDERHLPYFGGGWNLSQARSPVTLTAGMHTFAFLGCNPAGPRSDWATDTSAGSASCDWPAMLSDIRQLRADGIIPIVTLQYRESYQYEPLAQQRIDFGALAEAGAAIVSGSQAHQPQGFAFEHGAFIHYGLGNLFFDQMWSLETRQEFVDRHVFYDGRHISTELLTAILEDYARPRPMTADERGRLLSATFSASGW